MACATKPANCDDPKRWYPEERIDAPGKGRAVLKVEKQTFTTDDEFEALLGRQAIEATRMLHK